MREGASLDVFFFYLTIKGFKGGGGGVMWAEGGGGGGGGGSVARYR